MCNLNVSGKILNRHAYSGIANPADELYNNQLKGFNDTTNIFFLFF